MSDMKEIIFDCENNKIAERNYTQSEIDEALATREINLNKQLEFEKKRAAAEAKLAALGLTVDDLKALSLG